MSGKDFATKDLKTKILLGIGQSTTFEQTDEDYKQYLRRIANKGLSEESCLDDEKLDKIIHDLIDAGYAQNGSSRLRLTPEALEFLINNGSSTSPEDPEQSDFKPEPSFEADDLSVKTESTLIKPSELPRLPNGRDLDSEQHKANKNTVNKMGLRMIEVLAELELADGSITASKNRLGHEIKARTETEVAGGTYKKAYMSLQCMDLISLSEDNKEIRLTSKGREMISLIKAYPDHIRLENGPRIEATTGLHVLELVIRDTGLLLNPNMATSELPDSTDWWLPRGSSRSIIPRISRALNLSEDSATRRIYSLSKEKDGDTITNIKVNRSGLEHALLVQQELRIKENILDEEEVEEAEEFLQGCLQLAQSLGRTDLRDSLKSQYDNKSLFELSAADFVAEKDRLKSLFDSLRQDYVLEFSDDQAAA
jgi:hypothetical protein